MKNRKLLFIQKNFLGTDSAKQSLEMALAAASLEFQVSLFFMDDSIFQLIYSEGNTLSSLLKALPLYDIKNVYILQQSLTQRGLLPQDLMIPVIYLSCHEINALLNKYDIVLS